MRSTTSDPALVFIDSMPFRTAAFGGVGLAGGDDLAVASLQPEPSGTVFADFEFAGDTITYRELAETLESVLQRPFQIVEWAVPFLLDDLANDPENMTRKYRAVIAQGRGVAWAKADTFNARHSIPVTSLHEWVKENIAA